MIVLYGKPITDPIVPRADVEGSVVDFGNAAPEVIGRSAGNDSGGLPAVKRRLDCGTSGLRTTWHSAPFVSPGLRPPP